MINALESIQTSSATGKNNAKEKAKCSKLRKIKICQFLNALEQCDELDGSFDGPFVWKGKGSAVFSTPNDNKCYCCRLDCPLLKVGWTYKWTIQIENCGNCLARLGVSSSAHQLDEKNWLGGQQGGWSYMSGGCVFHDNKKVKKGLTKFDTGSIVTLKLDLSDVFQNGQMTGGTLSAFIEGQSNEIILVENIVQDGMAVGMNFVNGDGFYPAVSGHNNCRMKFVGFEAVE